MTIMELIDSYHDAAINTPNAMAIRAAAVEAITKLEADTARYQHLITYYLIPMARMLDVTFGNYTPNEQISTQIAARIDIAMDATK